MGQPTKEHLENAERMKNLPGNHKSTINRTTG